MDEKPYPLYTNVSQTLTLEPYRSEPYTREITVDEARIKKTFCQNQIRYLEPKIP